MTDKQYSAEDVLRPDGNPKPDKARQPSAHAESRGIPNHVSRQINPESAAEEYLGRGWSPIPVPRGDKAPRVKDWPKYVCDPSAIHTTFAASNVGVLLGERSGGLVDIDLDCPEAERLATEVLPATRAVFGRKSKPASHFLHVVDPVPKTKKFTDGNGNMLVELRSTACQTMFPGSVHPSGEHVVWNNHGDPRQVRSDELQEAVALLAAVSLIARHWPQKGSRQDTALALAGALYHAGVPGDRIPPLVEAIAIVAGDEESSARLEAAEATVTKARSNEPITGWPALAELIDQKVVDRCRKWLQAPETARFGGAGRDGGSGGGGDHPTDNGDGQRGRGRGRESYAQLLVQLAEEHVVGFFRDDDRSFATYHAGDETRRHLETGELRRKPFKDLLRTLFYDRHQTPPGSQAVQDAIDVLDARTQARGEQIATHTRVAPGDNVVYIDVCHNQWLAVEITPQTWTVRDQVAAKFVRRRGMTRLPLPAPGGSIDLLRPFLNVTKDDWVLVVAWLLAALRPHGPYPILVLSGEPGACKSTASCMLRNLVDPSRVPLRAEPREPRDFVIAAENSWILAFDNLSHLPPWLADGLCRIATGGGFGTRELYSDADERLFWAARPIILNGISDFASRSDLIDRSLCVNLPQVSKSQRRAESELWAAFNAARPRILGGLYEALSAALDNWLNVSLPTLPRMADFARWVTAAEPGLGWPPGTFSQAYAQNAQAASQFALENSPIFRPLVDFIIGKNSWKGTASDLLDELNQSRAVSLKAKQSKFWPETAAYLGTLLQRIAPNLREAGFTAQAGRTGRSRWWELAAPNAVSRGGAAQQALGQAAGGAGK